MSALSKFTNVAAGVAASVLVSANDVEAGELQAYQSSPSTHTRFIPNMCQDPNGSVYFNGARASGSKRSSNCCDFKGAANVLRDVRVQDKNGRWYATDVREKHCSDFGGGDNDNGGPSGHAGGVSDGPAPGGSTGL